MRSSVVPRLFLCLSDFLEGDVIPNVNATVIRKCTRNFSTGCLAFTGTPMRHSKDSKCGLKNSLGYSQIVIVIILS